MPTPTPEPDQQPDSGKYLDEPTYDHPQDDEDGVLDTLVNFRGFTLPMAPRDYPEALTWCAGQSSNRSKDWYGRCQEYVRTAPGCGGGFASAISQFYGMPDGARHVGGDPQDAPTGAALFSKSHDPSSSSYRYGHVMYVAHPFLNHSQGAWSTDALRTGWPDKINPADLYARWNHQYLGWGQNMNGLWLHLKNPKPVQDQHYEALLAAIARLENAIDEVRKARDVAAKAKDWKDRDSFSATIETLLAEKVKMRTKYDNLRRAA